MPAPSKRPTREQLAQAIRQHGGNLSRVSASLGCSRQSLYRWISELRLRHLAGLQGEELQRVTDDKSDTSLDGVTLEGRGDPSFCGMSDVTEAVTLQIPTADKEWMELRALKLKRELGLGRASMSMVLRRLIQLERAREQEQGQ